MKEPKYKIGETVYYGTYGWKIEEAVITGIRKADEEIIYTLDGNFYGLNGTDKKESEITNRPDQLVLEMEAEMMRNTFALISDNLRRINILKETYCKESL